jgi:hypothetical protein
MDAVTRVRDFLLDNIGHMTYPGNPSFDQITQHWFVPILCRTERGSMVVGDVKLDDQGHVIHAPGRDEIVGRLTTPDPANFQVGRSA